MHLRRFRIERVLRSGSQWHRQVGERCLIWHAACKAIITLHTVWEDEKDDGRCKDWVKDIMRGVVPFSKGAYLGDSDFQVRKTKFWTDEAADRLMKLRRKWDAKGIVSGYLDEGDISGTMGLDNQNWMKV